VVVCFVPTRRGIEAQSAMKIPVRTVTIVASSDSSSLGRVADVRAVGDDGVLVNDVSRLQIVRFEPNLRSSRPLLNNDGAGKYGPRPGMLSAYMGDSSVFVDLEAGALVVLDARGQSARSMAPPTSTDLFALMRYGAVAFDHEGALVYQGDRIGPPPGRRGESPAARPPSPAGTVFSPDSGAILRGNFDSRAVDTIALLNMGFRKVVTAVREDGLHISRTALNPLPVKDAWTLLPDGGVAIVRAHDYHIDWINRDGTASATAKMPIDWRRLTIEERQQLIDSLRQLVDPPAPGRVPSLSRPAILFVEPTDLPDFYPSVSPGQVKSDLSGNVWILPTTSLITDGGPVWDVVNRNGVIFERVQLPVDRRLVGFGPSGALYMVRKTATGEQLERARVVR
jgi:hypothetical protein